MATNEVYKQADQIPLVVGASVAARTPMCVGDIPVQTLTATGSTGTTTATCQTRGVIRAEVVGADGSGNAAVTAGDIIYFDTDELNVDSANGVRWGYALEDVASGDTSTILVKIGY